MAEEQEVLVSPDLVLEYVTSAVSLSKDDNIGVQVVNDSGLPETARVVIYQNTGAGAKVVADTGRVTVAATWTWGLSFPVKDPGEYWLRIQASSEALIPKASFERLDGAIWKLVESYRPGDFAVFSLTRKRLW
jgi:hypothetical protein